MTPERLQPLVAQYLKGELSAEEMRAFDATVDADPALKQDIESLRDLWEQLGLLSLPEPSVAMRAQFYQKLNAQVRQVSASEPQRRKSWGGLWQWASACVIFLAGLGLGHFAGRPMEELKPQPPSEISDLRNQVEGLRQTVALSLMQKPSASSRLEGVEWSSHVARPDLELITALVNTLNQDQNINVRLAALDALEKFTNETNVRSALQQSISKQQSPLVQIALIDALVHSKDRSAADEFKQLSGNASVNAMVRQRAQWAIQKLSVN